MTEQQRIELRLSQIRTRLNALNAQEELSEEEINERAELMTEFTEQETRWQSVVIANTQTETETETETEEETETRQDGWDGEIREVHEIHERASVLNFVQSADSGMALQGAEAEFAAAVRSANWGAGVTIPYEMLLSPEDFAEVRAESIEQDRHLEQFRAATTTSDHDGGTMQRNILRRLFGRSIAEFLGVRLDAVPAGQSEYPLITGGVAPAMAAESAAADQTKGVFTSQTLKPKRLAGQYLFTAEMMAQIGPGLETALRRDLADAVMSAQQQQICTGDGSAPNVTGLNKTFTNTTAAGKRATRSTYVGMAIGLVDGLYAYEESDIALLMSVDAFKDAGSFVNNNTDGHAIRALRERGVAVQASTYVPGLKKGGAPAKNSKVFARIGNVEGSSVAAMWPGLNVIRDNVTNAAKGQIAITWMQLWDAYVGLRDGAYKNIMVQTAD